MNSEDMNEKEEMIDAAEVAKVENISKASDERDVLQNEILYLKAEFDNYKKRMLREQDQSIKFGNEKLMRELLLVIDLFERGLMHGKELVGKASGKHAEDLKTFLSGIEMTHKELAQLLTRFGVEFVGAVGEKFDPSKHEAISQVEVDSDDKIETVVQVAQKGCSLHGRLLSPAKVVVGKSKAYEFLGT